MTLALRSDELRLIAAPAAAPGGAQATGASSTEGTAGDGSVWQRSDLMIAREDAERSPEEQQASTKRRPFVTSLLTSTLAVAPRSTGAFFPIGQIAPPSLPPITGTMTGAHGGAQF